LSFIKTDNINIKNSQSLSKFIKSVSIRNKNTAKQYYFRILLFEKFLETEYNKDTNLDKLILQLKNQEVS
jgi:hypothetical protein